MYSVYLITNKITNKSYVGFTNDVERRWYQHKWHGNNGGTAQLYKSMQKHGVDNFVFEILEDGLLSESIARQKEIEFIQKYNTYKAGYNGTLGGTGGDMSRYESWKESMIKMHATKPKNEYATYGMKDKKHKPSAIEKQSKARKDHWDNLTIEQRAQRGKNISGSKNGMFGKTPKNSVKLMYDGVEYNSIAAASRITGHSVSFLKKHGEILHYESQ